MVVIVCLIIYILQEIATNPLKIGFSLLFLLGFFALYKAITGFGFNFVKDDGNGKMFEVWIDSRKESKKKEPLDDNQQV